MLSVQRAVELFIIKTKECNDKTNRECILSDFIRFVQKKGYFFTKISVNIINTTNYINLNPIFTCIILGNKGGGNPLKKAHFNTKISIIPPFTRTKKH